MSSSASPLLLRSNPDWFWDFLGLPSPVEGGSFKVAGQVFVLREGIPRSSRLLSSEQAQTERTFGYKWKKRESFERPESLSRMRDWLIERYGEPSRAPWLAECREQSLLLDAGCGAGMSAVELLGPVIPRVHYLGIDVSGAVDVARARFAEIGLPGAFMQSDITDLPLPAASVDIIFSEGVLHHTDSTERALKALAMLLRPGGRFLFYVYRRKGPIREFTDDYLREQLKRLPPEAAWRAVEDLTRLGIALGELNAEIDIPAPVELLQIPAGRINVQRLFYWHVAKVFYRPEYTFDEMNHINFDWYAPANAHRQSPEEVRRWCREASLEIEREVVEEAGITVIATKRT